MTRNTRKKFNAKEWVKVASLPHYNLYQSATDMNLWQVRLSSSGGYLRRRFNAPTLKDALLAAPRVVGLLDDECGETPIPLADAFTMALNATNRREASRREWAKDSAKFLVWLRKRHPLCTHWKLMSRQIIREYLATYQGRADNHKRLRLQPILQTAGFMHREYGFPNIGERMGIGSKLKNPPRTVYLVDVLSFCDFLRDEPPTRKYRAQAGAHLEVGAALQGLAGLQLQEALRLKWTNVDLERGLIEVTGEVKNDYRNRVIPVMGRVLDALRRADARRRSRGAKVQDVAEHVVVGSKGEAYEDYKSYSRQMKEALLRWNPATDWAAKDLRNCLPTFAKLEGIHSTIWEQYIGHSPGTITERHYVPRLTARTMGESGALARAMELFRKFVVTPLEAYQTPQNLQLFATLGSEGTKGVEEAAS